MTDAIADMPIESIEFTEVTHMFVLAWNGAYYPNEHPMLVKHMCEIISGGLVDKSSPEATEIISKLLHLGCTYEDMGLPDDWKE